MRATRTSSTEPRSTPSGLADGEGDAARQARLLHAFARRVAPRPRDGRADRADRDDAEAQASLWRGERLPIAPPPLVSARSRTAPSGTRSTPTTSTRSSRSTPCARSGWSGMHQLAGELGYRAYPSLRARSAASTRMSWRSSCSPSWPSPRRSTSRRCGATWPRSTSSRATPRRRPGHLLRGSSWDAWLTRAACCRCCGPRSPAGHRPREADEHNPRYRRAASQGPARLLRDGPRPGDVRLSIQPRGG